MIKNLFLYSWLILLVGCCCPQHYHPCDNPMPLPDCPVVPQPVRLALILGGGGSKGLAHVGVLEELEQANIPINLVVGCSAGSIIGAMYCDCPCTQHLKSTFLKLNTNKFVDFDLWNARYGLCQGRSLRRFLDEHLVANNFEELKLPFYLVATDLYSSELVILGGGPLVPAIEASCSIPFIFVPVELHGRTLVDGGVIDPVPVRVAKHFNAEVTIAVDLRGLLPHTFPTNLFAVASRSAEITLLWQSECCIKDADVVIRPNLQGVGTFCKNMNEYIYQAGKIAAREAIPQILACLEKKAAEKRQQCEFEGYNFPNYISEDTENVEEL
jgi:NTE family protein